MTTQGGSSGFEGGSLARRAPPVNVGILIAPEKMAYVVERFGRYHTTLSAGLHFLIPIVDRIAYAHSLKARVFFTLK